MIEKRTEEYFGCSKSLEVCRLSLNRRVCKRRCEGDEGLQLGALRDASVKCPRIMTGSDLVSRRDDADYEPRWILGFAVTH